jgi:hypothetical protein
MNLLKLLKVNLNNKKGNKIEEKPRTFNFNEIDLFQTENEGIIRGKKITVGGYLTFIYNQEKKCRRLEIFFHINILEYTEDYQISHYLKEKEGTNLGLCYEDINIFQYEHEEKVKKNYIKLAFPTRNPITLVNINFTISDEIAIDDKNYIKSKYSNMMREKSNYFKNMMEALDIMYEKLIKRVLILRTSTGQKYDKPRPTSKRIIRPLQIELNDDEKAFVDIFYKFFPDYFLNTYENLASGPERLNVGYLQKLDFIILSYIPNVRPYKAESMQLMLSPRPLRIKPLIIPRTPELPPPPDIQQPMKSEKLIPSPEDNLSERLTLYNGIFDNRIRSQKQSYQKDDNNSLKVPFFNKSKSVPNSPKRSRETTPVTSKQSTPRTSPRSKAKAASRNDVNIDIPPIRLDFGSPFGLVPLNFQHDTPRPISTLTSTRPNLNSQQS